MSYQVLARKWRPQNFKQMVGQEHVLKALIHALESQRLHHAYLFTGTRGVGKTTIGRILAKCLSCHKGITSEPCGECGACKNIVEGRYVDLIEIDAASRTKVEDMRELLENVQYAPAEGRFKIYLIDEVHMLSQSSFNALLKTLEEPPEHVKFLFATTDPQKLPVTILSRCLQFNLKNMPPERIVGHLQNVLSQEQVQFEDPALWALARAADGSMRDALSLTDQAIAYGNNVLSESGVNAMLGTVDQKKIYRILACLVNRDAAAMLQEVNALAEFSPDYKSVLATLSEILHRVAIEQAVPGAIDNSMGDQEQISTYARALCAEDVQLFYQVSLVSRQDLAITPDPKSGLEMALLRMLAFQLTPSNASKNDLNLNEPVLHNSNNVEHVEGVQTQVAQTPPDSEPSSEHSGMHAADLSNNSPQNAAALAEESKKKTLLVEASPSVEPISSDVGFDQQTPIPELVIPIDEPGIPIDEPGISIDEPGISIDEPGISIDEPGISIDKPGTTIDEPSTTMGSSVAKTESATVAHNVLEAVAQNIEPLPSGVDSSEQNLSDPNEITLDKEGSSKHSGNAVKLSSAQGWNEEAIQLGLSGMTLNLLLNAVLEKEEGDVLKLYFDTGHFRLLNSNHEKRIREALLNTFNTYVSVACIEGLKPSHETPMMWRERKKAEMQVEAIENINSDPHVQQILEHFDGVLIRESIQAISGDT